MFPSYPNRTAVVMILRLVIVSYKMNFFSLLKQREIKHSFFLVFKLDLVGQLTLSLEKTMSKPIFHGFCLSSNFDNCLCPPVLENKAEERILS